MTKISACPSPVLRTMDGSERLQPKSKGPLPDPESYDSESCGPKPERPGVVKIGTLRELVAVTGLEYLVIIGPPNKAAYCREIHSNSIEEFLGSG